MRLLVGPTCAGKSTLIDRWSEFFPGSDPGKVHFAFEIGDQSAIPTGVDDVVHYNLLRGYRRKAPKAIGTSVSPLLPEFLDAADEIIVVGAPLSVLVKRGAGRTNIEPNHEQHAHRQFNKEFWGGVLMSRHLAQVFEHLALDLDRLGKPCRYLCSNGDLHEDFRELSRWDFPRLALDDAEEMCRRGHPEPVLEVSETSYQADYREGSARSARSATMARALRMPVDGKRVLDIGCAEGAAALSAHRMGAKVTAIEPWGRRFEQAKAIAKALDSKIDLRNVTLDGLSEPPNSFHVVLALNVIHHQPDPFAFVQRVADLASSHLVLEYPGINDRRFRSTFDHEGDLPEELPLIGVSTVKQDQTFVFNPASLERYLLDTLAIFGKHELIPSPKPNRWISVFSQKRPSARGKAGQDSRPDSESATRADEVIQLKNALRKMQRSRSWRLTAPLRQAKTGLRRVKRRLG
ncbi:methyltransferase domain-containing protein [Actinopolymorpha sp. B17G11]|uniref:class I SAM-dependent methyltransferase n=1 Tax=unclassified Actinopolymorpha TaxID=2627063 RepID=UPI0032D92AC6